MEFRVWAAVEGWGIFLQLMPDVKTPNQPMAGSRKTDLPF